METKVTGRHLDVTPAIRAYAENKVAKLPRYFDRVAHVEVVVDKRDRQFDVEIIAKADGTGDPFVSKSTGDDLYACIDDGVDKLERQLTDHKTKIRNRKHKRVPRQPGESAA